jgi:hypothetical protein
MSLNLCLKIFHFIQPHMQECLKMGCMYSNTHCQPIIIPFLNMQITITIIIVIIATLLNLYLGGAWTESELRHQIS